MPRCCRTVNSNVPALQIGHDAWVGGDLWLDLSPISGEEAGAAVVDVDHKLMIPCIAAPWLTAVSNGSHHRCPLMRRRLRRSRTSDPLMLFISWLVQSTITIESFTHQSSYPLISPSTCVRVHAYNLLPIHLSVPSSITKTKHTSTQARIPLISEAG